MNTLIHTHPQVAMVLAAVVALAVAALVVYALIIHEPGE